MGCGRQAERRGAANGAEHNTHAGTEVGSVCLVISYTEVFAGKPDGEQNLVKPAARVKKI